MWEAVDLDSLPTREAFRQALAQRHGAALQETLERSTVAVCGLGGLGSNIAIALARAGVGRLILIDFDRVDLANLNRQQYKVCQIGQPKVQALSENLLEIAPYLEILAHDCRITEENFRELLAGADVICEAFDNPESKAMLVNGVLEQLPDTWLVAGSGMAGMGSPNTIRTRRISKRFYLCGDGVSDVQAAGTLFAARVMVCAAHQAHTIIRILAGQYDV